MRRRQWTRPIGWPSRRPGGAKPKGTRNYSEERKALAELKAQVEREIAEGIDPPPNVWRSWDPRTDRTFRKEQ